MTITEIRILLVDDPCLKAFVSVTFDQVFVAKGLKIIRGKSERLFLAMPSRRRPNGEFQDVVHPLHQAFRNELEEGKPSQTFGASRSSRVASRSANAVWTSTATIRRIRIRRSGSSRSSSLASNWASRFFCTRAMRIRGFLK